MNAAMYRAFSEELTKIAIANAVARGFGNALKAGWKDTGGWMGTGRLTKYLPVGGKGLTAATAAIEAPSVMAKEDQTGQGRGRGERALGLAGNLIGGTVGMGAGSMAAKRLMRGRTVGPGMGKFITGAGQVAGGIAGSLALPHVLTAPSRALRKHQTPVVQEQQNADPVSGYGS